MGRLLWRTGLCHAFTIKTDLYRLRFFPTALSCAMWTDPASRGSDERFFRRYLRRGDAVVDVGANVGTLTLTAATLVEEAGRVWSIEAHPQTFRYLRENLALNHVLNVAAIQAAAADEAGTVRFADGRLDDQNHVSDATGPMAVPARRLDDLIPDVPVSLLKIDVEGFELFALRGAPKLLRRTECVYFECAERSYARYGYQVGDVLRVLDKAGFRTFETVGDELQPFVSSRGDHQNLCSLRPGSAAAARLGLSG
jgi:FkbM family methyltransferase